MEFGMLTVLVLLDVVAYFEISSLKKQLRAQQEQLDSLCRATENDPMSSLFVSEDVREKALCYKHSGQTAKAVKEVRAATSMDLLEAKQFVDKL